MNISKRTPARFMHDDALSYSENAVISGKNSCYKFVASTISCVWIRYN